MFTRYIYVYRWNGTNSPHADHGEALYVGSTWNAKRRHAGHTKGNLQFDGFLREHGVENFTVETVEAVTREERQDAYTASIERENFWMDKLGTLQNGWNMARADANHTENWLAATRAVQARPEVKARHAAACSVTMKKVAQTPTYRVACSVAQKRRNPNSPQAIKRREKIAAGLCGYQECPEKRVPGRPECQPHLDYFAMLGRARDARIRKAWKAKLLQ